MQGTKRQIELPRETLLVEIERRCGNPLCKARARMGLTKEEARVYRGFKCERCEGWTPDTLTARDVPEWWEELLIPVKINALGTGPAQEAYEPSEVVLRIWRAYRQAHPRHDDSAREPTLNETAPSSLCKGEGRNSFWHSPSERAVLPQWAFEVIRPALRTLSRLLWRMRFTGVENIPQQGGLLIAVNHQTYFDPFWVSIPIKRPLRYLAWDEAFNWPVAGKLIERLGAWPLQLEGKDPTPIRRSLQLLREGGAMMIFPEGGRGLPDGTPAKFKMGAVRIALEANVPVLPVTIRGAHRVWPKGKRLPRLAPVEIIYHPVHKVTLQIGEDARQCARREIDRLAAVIESAL